MSAKIELDEPVAQVTDLSDAAREPFDRICRLAQRLLGAETAIVTLIDEEKQTFLGRAGMPPHLVGDGTTPIAMSFCQYAVASGHSLVVPDARLDPLLRENPAIEQRGVVAYAGTPLNITVGDQAEVAGTLCVAESSPREWTEDEVRLLEELAGVAADEMAVRVRLATAEAIGSLAQRLPDPVEKLGSTVRACAQIAEDPEDPRLRRTLDRARARLEVVEALTDDLSTVLAAQERSTASTGRVDLRARVDRAVELVSSSARPGDVASDLTGHPVLIDWSPRELDRFVAAMLMTALTHLGDRETMTVRLEVDTRRPQAAALLRVESPGHAVPAGELLRVVGVLGTAHHDGTPVGVDYVGSDLRVQSRWVTATAAPDGTTFEVRLPVATTEQRPDGPVPVPRQPTR